MKYIQWAISISICILSLVYAFRLYDYFFEVTKADQVGLFLSLISGLLFFQRLNWKIEKGKSILLMIFFLILPFLIYPLVVQLILLTNLGWLAVYCFLILTTAGVITLFRSNLLIPVLVSFVLALVYPYDFQQEQRQFHDKVETAIQTRFGNAQVVRWKEDFWLYYNRQLQFSTIDRHMYQEAYVQPAMQLIPEDGNVLLIGGDNGIIEDELSKFQNGIALTILTMDHEFYNFSRSNSQIPIRQFKGKRAIEGTDVFAFLSSQQEEYDLIIVELPDPITIDYKQYYTSAFYQQCYDAMKGNGFLVTQTGDYYKNGLQSKQIWNSVEEAGMHVLPLQCQIPTIGQWSWVIGSKTQSDLEMKRQLSAIAPTATKWWNQEAANLMMSFGKDYFSEETDEVNYLVTTKPDYE